MNNGDRGVGTLVATDSLARAMRNEGFEDTLKAITGLTKREYFAVMAMQSLTPRACDISKLNPHQMEIAVKASVYMADGLLKELEK